MLYSRRNAPSLSSSSWGSKNSPTGRRGAGPYSKLRVSFRTVACPSKMAAQDAWETGCFSGWCCTILTFKCLCHGTIGITWVTRGQGRSRTQDHRGTRTRKRITVRLEWEKITVRLGWDETQTPYTKRASQKAREKLQVWLWIFRIDGLSLSS